MGTVTSGEKIYKYTEPKDKNLNEWPCVFLYYYTILDEYSSVPLHNGKPWKLIIFNLKEYEELARSGKIYHPSHTGVEPNMTDNQIGALTK